MLSGLFRKHVELLDSNWMEILSRSANAKLQLNGIEISGSRAKLESVLNQKKVKYSLSYPIPADKSKKAYKCEGYKYNLENDKVVGFALTYTDINRDYIEKYLGLPDKELPIVGQVYNMYDWELDGYTWEYEKLNLEISLDVEKLTARTFFVGKKLSWLDDY